MAESVRFLVAQREILTDRGSRCYEPGDILPASSPEAEAWVSCGSAVWVAAEDLLQAGGVTVKPVVAQPGMPGIATGGEMTGDDLVGRIPLTRERSE